MTKLETIISRTTASAVADLIERAGRQVELPGPRVDELEDAAEADPEDQRARDRKQGRSELVRASLAQHVVEQLRCGGIEPVVVHKLARKRVRMRVEVLLHHEQRREDGDEDVDGEEGRLQRSFDRAVPPPGLDRDPGRRARILPLDPILTAA